MTSDISPAMPIKACEHMRKLPASPERIPTHFGRTPSFAYLVTVYESSLADAWQKDQAIHAQNEPAITHNQAMRDRIKAIMTAAGIMESYRAEDPRSRSRWPRHKTFPAGYLGDIGRAFPIDDGFDLARRTWEDRAKVLAAAKTKVDQEKADKAKAAEAEKAKRKADIALAGMIVRYQLADDIDWSGALDAICRRDKYLDLAVAGHLTRGDWSEGFWRVEGALKRFRIDSDRDKDIAADLCGCLSSDRDDGRIFRDTAWGYEKLFELVEDKTLLADANVCLEHVVR